MGINALLLGLFLFRNPSWNPGRTDYLCYSYCLYAKKEQKLTMLLREITSILVMMLIMLILLSPLIAFLFYKVKQAQGKFCPSCGTPLFPFQHPITKTIQQWKQGGYRCRNCGCLTDLDAKEIPDGPYPKRRTLLLVLMGLNLLLIISFLSLVYFYFHYINPNK